MEAQDEDSILVSTPTGPETDYGCITHQGEKGVNQENLVEGFVEKPDVLTAAVNLTDGNCLWNGGMFVMRASTLLASKTRAEI